MMVILALHKVLLIFFLNADIQVVQLGSESSEHSRT